MMLDLSPYWPALQSYFATHDPWMLPLIVLLGMSMPLLQTLLSRRGESCRDALAQRDAALRALEAERAAHEETRKKLEEKG
ncbi:hypothetical protein [Acidomonas methanolica]|uniref:hypothetical protein n=1 Tax=Acidomonas methanolica TaxID=437 RepID=UPI002119BCE4|nr:hypothetical protein [Acidomonas methanolica]MCQ9155701.1 hypothetical protein [Acidomonas methanolica]